jgi:hypothetical protein
MLIHTIYNSLQHILSLLSLLCLHQSFLLPCPHSQLTFYSSDCCLKIQCNSHNFCPDSHVGSHRTPTSYFSPLNYFKNILLLLQLVFFIDSAETHRIHHSSVILQFARLSLPKSTVSLFHGLCLAMGVYIRISYHSNFIDFTLTSIFSYFRESFEKFKIGIPRLYLQVCIQSYLCLAAHKRSPPPILSAQPLLREFQNLTISSLSHPSFNHWEMYIMKCPLQHVVSSLLSHVGFLLP